MWHSRLRISHCHCIDLGCCCSVGLIPGLAGNFYMLQVWPKNTPPPKFKKLKSVVVVMMMVVEAASIC